MKNILFISLLVSFVGCRKPYILKQQAEEKPVIKNTAIGSTAMEEDTTGSFNTGIGCDCGMRYPDDWQFGWLGFIDGKSMIWNGKTWEDFKH